jgi:hypothetical protein
LEFTCCRSYHKNDQAWVEQKNGSVVRRLVGHQRFSGFIVGQPLAHLYHHARLYMNYFHRTFGNAGRDKIHSIEIIAKV